MSPLEREYREVWLQEQRFLRRYETKTEIKVNHKLEELVPEKLVETVHTAFVKAFGLVFEKGTGVILRAGRLQERRQAFRVNQYAAALREDRKSLRAFSRAANQAGRENLLVSGAAGLGMGLLGVALPDIPLFTAMLLKSVYETAESFGFSWETEKLYVLRLIEAALSDGQALQERNCMLDTFAQTGAWLETCTLEEQMDTTARRLSETVLYAKALQSIPVVGVVGGAGDAVCLQRVQRYAFIKYRKRFLLQRWLERELIEQ